VLDLEFTFALVLDLEFTFAFVLDFEFTFALVIVSFVVALMFGGGVDEVFVVCEFSETSLFTCSVAALFTDVSELRIIPMQYLYHLLEKSLFLTKLYCYQS
jgi:hypothetical protein